MKLLAQLEIDGVAWPLAEWRVALGLNQVGAGTFLLREPEEGAEAGPVRGAALRCWLGHAGGTLYPLLLGHVADAQPAGPGGWRVLARELCAVLEASGSLALRHVTPSEVLEALGEVSGAAFATAAEADYLLERLPCWMSTGTCRAALDGLGRGWGLDDAVWFQQADGRIWWGRWADSVFNTAPLEIPSELALAWDSEARSVELPVIPALRPGARVLVGELDFVLRRLTWEGERMRLEWGDA